VFQALRKALPAIHKLPKANSVVIWLGSVLHQTTIAGLHGTELPPEDAKRVFDLGPNTRFQAFYLIEYCV
jgi:hypothetical protein